MNNPPSTDLTDSEQLELDQKMMRRVFELALQGKTTTQPNPMVGCVIVADGKIVGEGYHVQAGELHAERIALQHAGELARGATAYVNLEPCCHQGRTPPCTDGLIDAGIARVVAAMSDPNPLVAGGGFELLSRAGIEVDTPMLESQARWLNRAFVTRMTTEKPWVRIKTAATLDGRTAAFDGQSKWITGPEARAQVQVERAQADTVITGIGTILADDPSLNVRLPDAPRQPKRIVLDTKLRIPLDAKTVAAGAEHLLIATSHDAVQKNASKVADLEDLGVEILVVKQTPLGRLDLLDLLDLLAKWQFNEVLVEAGSELSGAFIQQGLADELVLFYAGSVLGTDAREMFKFDHAIAFDDRSEFKIKDVAMVGSDVCLHAFNKASLERLLGEDLSALSSITE